MIVKGKPYAYDFIGKTPMRVLTELFDPFVEYCKEANPAVATALTQTRAKKFTVMEFECPASMRNELDVHKMLAYGDIYREVIESVDTWNLVSDEFLRMRSDAIARNDRQRQIEAALRAVDEEMLERKNNA